MDFETMIRSRCLITDGALGTYYGEKDPGRLNWII